MILRYISLLTVGFSLLIFGCSNSDSGPSSGKKSTAKDSFQTKKTALAESYSNAQYDISLKKPANWILLEEPNLKPAMGTFAINLFKRGTGAEKETPLQVHAKAQHSYLAIWPHGYGTELPASQYAQFDTLKNLPEFQFQIDQQASKALVLKDGSVWAYNIVPKNPPANWEKYGFIFAQVASTNNLATCYDEQTGKEIPLKKCDFLGGDRYVRQANLNQKDVRTIRKVLESISLDKIEAQAKLSDLIDIEKPLPNMDVTSPLTVKGKARGNWYFEGSFLIELFDVNGNKLAEKQANAESKWMTENFVPFKATLTFNAPDDQRGRLVFHRANPSGLEKNAMTWSQPVIFPPK